MASGPFAVDPEVNVKLILWQGDICSLEAMDML